METIKNAWKITDTKVHKRVKSVFSSTSMVAVMLFTMAFLGCNKEETPPREQEVTVSLRAKVVEDRSETVPVVIKGKDFGRDRKAVRVRVNGEEVEVSRVEDKEITVMAPIRYEVELTIEVFLDGRLILKTLLESFDMTSVSTVAGSTGGFADGPVATARFSSPHGVAVDANGTIYVADSDNHKIRKIASNGMVSTLAGSTQGFADGNGADAKFYYPTDVAVDASGNVYVADLLNHKIRIITPDGHVSSVAGSSQGFSDGEGTMAKFNYPKAIDVDAFGNLYVADRYNNKIRKIIPELKWIPGTLGYSTVYKVITFARSDEGYADGQDTAAKFDEPSGIAVDKQGHIYVSDKQNNKIRRINPDGYVSTLAGSTIGFANGPGATAKFDTLNGIAVDNLGNAYVPDGFNYKIRKITTDGYVSTVAGSTYGFADGHWSLAKFNYPVGVAVGPQGNVFVADTWNDRIRKITLDD